MSGAVIIGTGSCLPQHVLTNHDLEKMVDTSDEWITTRTGIKTRHIAGPGEKTSTMAAVASQRALKMAGLAPGDLDLIIVATMSPEKTMPACGCLVQKEIGAGKAAALDINAACSGFIYGLDIVDKYIKADPAMKILLVGAETVSARINWQDRNTCILFGDGAGACVMTGGEAGRGIMASRLYSDGQLWKLLYLDNLPRRACPAVAPATHFNARAEDGEGSAIHMEGRDVFKYAVRAMAQAVSELLARTGVAIDELAMVIPHQANIRILKSLAERLGLPLEKMYVNVQKYGNTSAASVPIAIDEANRAGRLHQGDMVLYCTFGGGFTWGTTLMRW
jgi:3-oxoacyl-[acyl-carrier-protein] synthase-3